MSFSIITILVADQLHSHTKTWHLYRTIEENCAGVTLELHVAPPRWLVLPARLRTARTRPPRSSILPPPGLPRRHRPGSRLPRYRACHLTNLNLGRSGSARAAVTLESARQNVVNTHAVRAANCGTSSTQLSSCSQATARARQTICHAYGSPSVGERTGMAPPVHG